MEMLGRKTTLNPSLPYPKPKLTQTSPNAAYWIAFGPHGPRALPPPDEGKKVLLYTFIGLGVSFVVFAAMRMVANPAPHTMNKEWQEATNEYLKV